MANNAHNGPTAIGDCLPTPIPAAEEEDLCVHTPVAAAEEDLCVHTPVAAAEEDLCVHTPVAAAEEDLCPHTCCS